MPERELLARVNALLDDRLSASQQGFIASIWNASAESSAKGRLGGGQYNAEILGLGVEEIRKRAGIIQESWLATLGGFAELAQEVELAKLEQHAAERLGATWLDVETMIVSGMPQRGTSVAPHLSKQLEVSTESLKAALAIGLSRMKKEFQLQGDGLRASRGDRNMATVLLVAASPLDQDRLRLNNEIRNIKRALERSRNREDWRIESNEAATVEDLRRALLDHRPTIVHFSGHGEGASGLCFEDEQGLTHPTHAGPLARLFHHFKDDLRCVVLNACYSKVQAEEVRRQVDYVVGMQGAVGDEAATKFAVAFYDAIFAGTSFRVAFDLACTAIDLHGLPEAEVPIFLVSPQLGGTELVYTEDIPEIENIILAYLNTPYGERYRFTTKGEKLVEAMKQYYGDSMPVTTREVVVVSKQQVDEQYWRVRVRSEGIGEDDFFLRIRGRSVMIEWEATVGLWSTPVKTYLAFGGTGVVARVVAELDNYYNCWFRDRREMFQSLKLSGPGLGFFHGYVERGTEACHEIIDILKDGRSHEITLVIASVDEYTDHALVQAVLSRTWILPDEDLPQVGA